MTGYTATYSPDDNKLRLYASTRLDAETYERVRAAGFSWAPKQGLFVAPMWTPWRADLLLELAGEIGDEDTSLVARAEDRAERFEEYSEKRAADADSAHAAVRAIADHIPLGQPILVGHHSERHARRDAERIENGMRKAVRMWETSKYWQSRAAGAIANAKYKERPDVRARRIKGLESDQRKQTKTKRESETLLQMWTKVHEQPDADARKRNAIGLSNYDYISQCFPLDKYPRQSPASMYEGQMSLWSALTDGVIDAQQAAEIAIRCHRRVIANCDRWLPHIGFRLEYERAMLAESGGTPSDRTGPEVGGAVRCWPGPRGGWLYIQKVNKVSVAVLDNWGNGGKNFRRNVPMDKLQAVMTAAEVATARAEKRLREIEGGRGFFLTDAPPTESRPVVDRTPTEFDAMKETLKAGVQVVAVPQLFATPRDLADQVVAAAAIGPDHSILEPSAGTGALVEALARAGVDVADRVFMVEINTTLAQRLANGNPSPQDPKACRNVLEADFLTLNGELGLFDRIVMNPPFENGADIKHIEHARHMLAPGGRLVAICANGPRQRAALEPIASRWEDLPTGTFKDQGTMVNAALVVIEAR